MTKQYNGGQEFVTKVTQNTPDQWDWRLFGKLDLLLSKMDMLFMLIYYYCYLFNFVFRGRHASEGSSRLWILLEFWYNRDDGRNLLCQGLRSYLFNNLLENRLCTLQLLVMYSYYLNSFSLYFLQTLLILDWETVEVI